MEYIGICERQYEWSGKVRVENRKAAATSATAGAGIPISPKDQTDILELYEKIRAVEAKLVGPDGRMRVLPKNVYSFLCQLLAELQGGNAVTILQPKAQLTTREASKLLGMSRQFLVNLLERQEIPYHKVETHRRIYARDIFAFKAKRDNARRKGLDDLARTEYAEGVYVKLRPDDSNPGQ